MASPTPQQIEQMLIRELRRTAEELAWSLFRKALRAPIIELVDTETVLGRWVPQHRTLEISRSLPRKHPWGVVVEVLKHEMAHQYVDEVLGVHDETAHGAAFRQVCTRFGVDAAASGVPSASGPHVRDDAEARLLSRIGKLLALAESPNEHEARSAAAVAQKLMLEHNVSVAKKGETLPYSYRHLGKPTGRVQSHARLIAAILEKHFFVAVIWVPVWRVEEAKRGSVLEICGTESNLELANYVHDFLLHTAERLWEEHKRAHGEESDKERRNFLAGVMTGFMEQLDAQKKVHTKAGLVWVGDAELQGFYRARNPHVVRVSYGAGRLTEAHAHGREQGRKIVLTKPMHEASSQQRGRLLGTGGSGR